MASRAANADPLGAFNFYITLIDSSSVAGILITATLGYALAGFSDCSGLDATIETADWREGGENTYVHHFATRTTHSNLTLKHGLIYLYDDLWNWHYSWVQGLGKRKDGMIVLMDDARNPAKIWKFKGGIPTKWIGPVFNASQSSVAFEAVEIIHQGLEMQLGN